MTGADVVNRIEKRFGELRGARRKGLIPFVTAGDPEPEWMPAIMHALVAAGADLLELGVPFSDPMADGPVIQKAGDRAISKRVGLRRVLMMVARFRERDQATPVVLMGYLNPIEAWGHEAFCAAAQASGVDGLLLVDMPLEESGALAGVMRQHGLEQIHLVAPTTDAARIERIAAVARGYMYYVSFAGITGADRITAADVGARVAALRAVTAAPIAIGFGIKSAEQAATLAAYADGVVIGSALVEALAGAATQDEATGRASAFLAPIRAALDRG